MVQVLLNETNFFYSYSISRQVYDSFRYNFKTAEELKSENPTTVKVLIDNRKVSDINDAFELDTNFNEEEKLKILFERYHKLFLVMKKGLKLPQNLQFKHYKEIAKYI